jgi:hypothetical protein
MKLLTCLLAITALLTGCVPQHEASGISADSKNKKMLLVYPPQTFIDAVFNYKKKNILWPYALDNVCPNLACLQDYRAFFEKGMESVKISKSTRDTMLLDFVYSRRKNAAYFGHEKNKLLSSDITGQYEFVHDSSFVFFRVIFTKPKLFSASFK